MIEKIKSKLQKNVMKTPTIPVGKRIGEEIIHEHGLNYTRRTSDNLLVMRNNYTEYHIQELGGCLAGYFEVINKSQI
jgi:hypothetical protein